MKSSLINWVYICQFGVPYNSFRFVSICFVSFCFVSICFVSFRSVSFRFDLFRFVSICFVSFRFVFVSFRTLQGPCASLLKFLSGTQSDARFYYNLNVIKLVYKFMNVPFEILQTLVHPNYPERFRTADRSGYRTLPTIQVQYSGVSPILGTQTLVEWRCYRRHQRHCFLRLVTHRRQHWWRHRNLPQYRWLRSRLYPLKKKPKYMHMYMYVSYATATK